MTEYQQFLEKQRSTSKKSLDNVGRRQKSKNLKNEGNQKEEFFSGKTNKKMEVDIKN